MEHLQIACLFFTGIHLGQPAAPPDNYYVNVAAAGRDLQNQIDFMNRALATIPGPPMGRGFFKENTRIAIDLTFFRQQVQNKVSRDDLFLAFTPVDAKLNTLLTDLQAFGKWDPAIQMAARRAQSAQQEVHFALSAGIVTPESQSQIIPRQIQALLNRETDLESLAGIALDDPDTLKSWNADFANVRKAMAELQRLQKQKAGRDDLKLQLVETDRIWEKLVTRFKALPTDQSIMLREDFGQVDQVIGRLAPLLGIDNRRATLPTSFGSESPTIMKDR
jgi:hypothetical protein